MRMSEESAISRDGLTAENAECAEELRASIMAITNYGNYDNSYRFFFVQSSTRSRAFSRFSMELAMLKRR